MFLLNRKWIFNNWIKLFILIVNLRFFFIYNNLEKYIVCVYYSTIVIVFKKSYNLLIIFLIYVWKYIGYEMIFVILYFF